MPPPPKHFVKAVLTAVRRDLALLRFEKRRAGLLATTLATGVLGTVGLNVASGEGLGALEINPVVGIRNQEVERYVAELLGERFDELVPPTVAGNVGYLSPSKRYLLFTFVEGVGVDRGAAELCEAIKVYGLPFMRRLTPLPALVEALETLQFGIPDVTNYRLPVGKYLLGRREEAKIFLERRVGEIGGRDDPAARRYKRFAIQLGERLRASDEP